MSYEELVESLTSTIDMFVQGGGDMDEAIWAIKDTMAYAEGLAVDLKEEEARYEE